MATEREKRGYELTEEERIAQNTAFLKGDFLERATSSHPELTIGALAGVPGMTQGHVPIAIDTLTGMMFLPEELGSSGYGTYQTQEKDIAFFDYVYLTPDLRQPQWIQMPPEYTVFPFRLNLSETDMKALSAEAASVLAQTRALLFKPVFPAVRQALALAQDNPKILNIFVRIADRIEKSA